MKFWKFTKNLKYFKLEMSISKSIANEIRKTWYHLHSNDIGKTYLQNKFCETKFGKHDIICPSCKDFIWHTVCLDDAFKKRKTMFNTVITGSYPYGDNWLFAMLQTLNSLSFKVHFSNLRKMYNFHNYLWTTPSKLCICSFRLHKGIKICN